MRDLPNDIRQWAERLRIGTHRSFQGRWAGDRTSRARGMGIEFADFRPYQPGDDFRYVDWNLYARLGRLYLRVSWQEQDLSIRVLIDTSASMSLGDPSKLAHARQITMLLAHIAISHADAIQLFEFGDGIQRMFPVLRGRSQLPRLRARLAGLACSGVTDYARTVKHLLQQTPRAGVLFLISDMLGDRDYRSALPRFSTAGHEVHLLHLLAQEEVDPILSGDFRLRDVETGETREIRADPASLTRYRQRLADFCDGLHAFCRTHGFSYTRCTTGETLQETLLNLRRQGVLQM